LKYFHKIVRFEHQRLIVGQDEFTKTHLDSLIKLNEYHEGRYFEVIYEGVKFNQYVGVIQVDGLTIEIHPKADKNDSDSKWQGVLIGMLQACGKIRVESSGVANVSTQNLNLLEIYFEMYLKEISQLERRGFIKQYQKETSNVKYLKGKLDFAGNIRHNITHKERFYTTHQIYDANHLLHQVLYYALSIVSNCTKGTKLYDACNRVMINFPKVDKKIITSNQIDSIIINRKTTPYLKAIELARLIILNYSPDIRVGNEKMLSLLFDMNKLWEEYVLVKVGEYARKSKSDIEVLGQDSKPFWKDNKTNYSRYIRPDIVIKQGENIYIIDTKWKKPYNQKASIEDIRQMYAYNRFWNSHKY
jgi:5-methylcytosine-specific restriction enzyme subunit McrC